jgi:hypothetical protein
VLPPEIPLPPLPPKPFDDDDDDEEDEAEEDEEDEDEMPALPRVPADVLPALRLAVVEPLGAAELGLRPTELVPTWPATEAALLVAALTRALVSAADLLVAATPPPVPDAWPLTADRDAWSAVERAAACSAAGDDGLLPGAGDGE